MKIIAIFSFNIGYGKNPSGQFLNFLSTCWRVFSIHCSLKSSWKLFFKTQFRFWHRPKMLPSLQIHSNLSFLSSSCRLWSSGCRSRYQGGIGRLKFLKRPFCIIGEWRESSWKSEIQIHYDYVVGIFRYNHNNSFIDCDRNGNIGPSVCSDSASRFTFFPNSTNGANGSSWWNLETSWKRRLCTQTSKKTLHHTTNWLLTAYLTLFSLSIHTHEMRWVRYVKCHVNFVKSERMMWHINWTCQLC